MVLLLDILSDFARIFYKVLDLFLFTYIGNILMITFGILRFKNAIKDKTPDSRRSIHSQKYISYTLPVLTVILALILLISRLMGIDWDKM